MGKLRFAVAILIIFGLPISMLYVTSKGTSAVSKTEPSIKLIQEPQKVEGSFSFISHQTDTITEAILKNKVLLVSFFNLPPTEWTQRMHYKLAEVQKSTTKYEHLRLISVSDGLFDANISDSTVKVENERAEGMNEYERVTKFARKFSSNANWHFLDGTASEAARYYRALGFPAVQADIGNTKEYKQVALVDKEGGIRGYYDPMDDEEIELLVQDLLYLLFVADGKWRAY